MKLTRNTLRPAIWGAALAAILATAAGAQTPSWPTPPTPQAEGPPAPEAGSPTAPQSEPASKLSPARLWQMLAPVALYPDDLLADVFVAATYPLDVVEAARWLQDAQNAALKGDQLIAALQQKPWDPSVKSLTSFPQILRMLDANLEWTEELGEAYLADPAAVMDTVQGLRRRAQLAGRLATTPQEIVRPESQRSPIEEPITIEAPGPDVVFVPICDPSFAYAPWPYPDYPPFFPLFAGAAINGCDWISAPFVAPFFGFAILNFRARHIEIDRKRSALFDRDREKDRERPLGEEWRHDPGHRGNVPYRNPAVRALFQGGTPAAGLNPGSRGRWTGLPPVVPPRAVALPEAWRQPKIEGAGPQLENGRRRAEEMRAFPEGGRPLAADVRPRSVGAQPALEGVDPTWDRAPIGQPLGPDTERRLLIERWSFGRVPSTAEAAPFVGLRTSSSFGGMGATQPVGARRFFRPLLGAGVPAYGFRGRNAIGVHPFNGQGLSGGMGASGVGHGR